MQEIFTNILYLNMSATNMWRKKLHKIAQLYFAVGQVYKIAISGQNLT